MVSSGLLRWMVLLLSSFGVRTDIQLPSNENETHEVSKKVFCFIPATRAHSEGF